MITSLIFKYSSYIIEIFFPPYCYVCKKENKSLCDECLHTFTRAVDTPAPYITSIYSFKGSYIKKIIHAIKYFHRKDLIAPFAKILSDEIRKGKDYYTYTLVPIPMPPLRKYIRGYNHTEELSKQITKEISLHTINTILTRSSSGSKKRQVRAKSRRERLHNQRNAFTVSSPVNGMNIILIDDVTTTGATLHEARKLLLKHGASRVIAYTIAH